MRDLSGFRGPPARVRYHTHHFIIIIFDKLFHVSIAGKSTVVAMFRAAASTVGETVRLPDDTGKFGLYKIHHAQLVWEEEATGSPLVSVSHSMTMPLLDGKFAMYCPRKNADSVWTEFYGHTIVASNDPMYQFYKDRRTTMDAVGERFSVLFFDNRVTSAGGGIDFCREMCIEAYRQGELLFDVRVVASCFINVHL